jgi:hypothetical protein
VEDQALRALRDQLGDIVLGTVFLFIGLAACSIAGVRRRGGGLTTDWVHRRLRWCRLFPLSRWIDAERPTRLTSCGASSAGCSRTRAFAGSARIGGAKVRIAQRSSLREHS